MRTLSGLVTIAFAVEAALGSPIKLVRRAGYEVKERSILPRKWSRVTSAPADSSMLFTIGLKQSNFNELERQLYEGE